MEFSESFDSYLESICRGRSSHFNNPNDVSFDNIISVFGGRVEYVESDIFDDVKEFSEMENICLNRESILEYLRWIEYLVKKYNMRSYPMVKEDKDNYMISFAPSRRRVGKSRSRRYVQDEDVSVPKEYLVVEKLLPELRDIIKSYQTSMSFNIHTFKVSLDAIISYYH